MSEEGDSWFKSALGVDLGEAASRIKNEVVAAAEQVQSTVSQVVGGARQVVDGAIDEVANAAIGLAKKAASVASPGDAPPPGAGGGVRSGTGSFPLGGSVGRGGQNADSDVRAVQSALGIAADGQCGSATIAAIEAYQRSLGQAKPDGRVDAGGATEQALRRGTGGLAAAVRNQVAPTPLGPGPSNPFPFPPDFGPEPFPPIPPTPRVPPVPVAPVAGAAAEGAAATAAAVAGRVGLVALAATPVGAAVVAGGLVAGVAGPYLIGKFLDHAKEVDEQGDPDERSLPGGLPPQQAPSGLPTDPAADPLDGGAPAQAPGLETPGARDPEPPRPAELPSGSNDDPAVLSEFEQAISDHAKKADRAQAEVAGLEQALADELATVEKDEAMLSQLERQKREGTFDPKIGAMQAKVQSDFDLTRRTGTTTKDVDTLHSKINALSDENLAIQTKIEIESDVNRTISTLKASDFQKAAQVQSRKLSALGSRLDTAHDQAIELQVRNGKIGQRLKGL